MNVLVAGLTKERLNERSVMTERSEGMNTEMREGDYTLS